MKNIILKIVLIVGMLAGTSVFVYPYYYADRTADVALDSVSVPDQALPGDASDNASSLLAASSSLDPADNTSEDLADAQEITKSSPQRSNVQKPIQISGSGGDDMNIAIQASDSASPADAANDQIVAGDSSAVSAKDLPQLCSSSNNGAPSRKVILNEIAWMGSPPAEGGSAASASASEWIELKNISADAVDVAGWQILGSTGKLKIVLGAGGSNATEIPAGGFYLLARNSTASSSMTDAGMMADADYSGALSNSGEALAVFDTNCGTSDFFDASSGWPGGNNTTKQTLERDADGVGWHTSVLPGGTPRAENSVPASIPVPAAVASSTPLTASFTPRQYPISVSAIGNGSGAVLSSPAGILCGFTCQATYASGTNIIFTEAPSQGSMFKGWSGGCSGTGKCSVAVSSPVSVIADFELLPTATLSGSQNQSDGQLAPVDAIATGTPTGLASPSVQLNHLVIAQVQIGGASSTNDLVKLFNPTGVAVDVSGWKLRKRSSTGTDYSVRAFEAGSVIPAGGYFVWANSSGGFADAIGANVSSTETLSADNSVALFDANGTIVDEVAWGTGTNQYVEGAAYPTDPVANQILARVMANDVMVDTDNNATDFAML